MDGDSGEETDDKENDDKGNVDEVIDLSDISSPVVSCTTNIHQNYPVLCSVFKDPENQFEKVVLAVALPGGAIEPRIEVTEDGLVALVKYGWPRTIFNLDDLFMKELQSKAINEYHPKILCLKNALESVRERVDACPEGQIKVNLPIKIQTATDTWSKGRVKREDGTFLAFAQFKGYIKEYNKKTNESKLTIDL